MCGDPSALGLLSTLSGIMGESLDVRHYDRLKPLVVSARPSRLLLWQLWTSILSVCVRFALGAKQCWQECTRVLQQVELHV